MNTSTLLKCLFSAITFCFAIQNHGSVPESSELPSVCRQHFKVSKVRYDYAAL